MTEADWAAHIADLEARRPFHDLELCRLNESGQQVWVSVSGEPIFDTDGRFEGYRGIGKDITARKREEKLLALEHAVTRSLAESESASAAMTSVIRALCEAEGWECGRYLRVDEPTGVLRFSEYLARAGRDDREIYRHKARHRYWSRGRSGGQRLAIGTTDVVR